MTRVETFKDLSGRLVGILGAQVDTRDGREIPEPEDVGFREGVYVETTALLIDMRDSIDLSVGRWRSTAAKIYQAFFECIVRSVGFVGGLHVRGFAGDRLLAISRPDDSRTTRAWRAALMMNTSLNGVLNPQLDQRYGHRIRFGIGLADGPLLAVRVGIRGTNDLVWAGNAVNIASKLADLEGPTAIRVEARTHGRIREDARSGCSSRKYKTDVVEQTIEYYRYTDCG